MTSVAYETDTDVALLLIDHPPVNALSSIVRNDLAAALTRAGNDPNIKAILLLCAGAMFVSGADLKELGTERGNAKPDLHDIIAMIEGGDKPVIAAMHGTALGGGLELALACHARLATSSARLGLPEVRLGLIPGGGGTQRLPRLTGPEAAIDIMTSGQPISAGRALQLGIIDDVVADLQQGAKDFARRALAERRSFAPVIQQQHNLVLPPEKLEAIRAKTRSKARGRLAPSIIVDCVVAACSGTAADGLAYERARFAEVRDGEQHKALKHIFSAERTARIIPSLTSAPLPIERAAVIGAGAMGTGIAMTFANAGIPCLLIDVDRAALDRAIGIIDANYRESVKRGALSSDHATAARQSIAFAGDYASLGDVDIVIEAAFEDMAVKQDIFGRLDAHAPSHAILATNTSSLDIDQIAAATTRPDKVVGTHFFSPAHIMKLMENVRGAYSSDQTIATVMALGRRLGKVPVLAGNRDGFIGNSMLQFYTGEAEFLLEEGAGIEQIDRVAEEFGMAMGPLSMRDLAGLDVAVAVRRQRAPTLPADERKAGLLEALVAAGLVGRKGGAGFYRYQDNKKSTNLEALAIVEAHAADQGITRRAVADDEIRDRLFAPLVNAGAQALADGIAIRAGDIDTVWVNGYGFPAHKGGPMFWGEQVGLDIIHAIVTQQGVRNGSRWAPSALLSRLTSQEDKTFANLST